MAFLCEGRPSELGLFTSKHLLVYQTVLLEHHSCLGRMEELPPPPYRGGVWDHRVLCPNSPSVFNGSLQKPMARVMAPANLQQGDLVGLGQHFALECEGY